MRSKQASWLPMLGFFLGLFGFGAGIGLMLRPAIGSAEFQQRVGFRAGVRYCQAAQQPTLTNAQIDSLIKVYK